MTTPTQASSNIATLQRANVLQIQGNNPNGRGYDRLGLGASLAQGNPDYVGIFDDFLGDSLMAQWATDIDAGGAIAINAQANGVARFTTDTTDNDNSTLALGLNFLVSNGLLVAEARIAAITDILVKGIEFGVSDALSETLGRAFSDPGATPVAVADDAAVLAFDTDTGVVWNAASVNGGGTPASNVLTEAPVAGTFQRLRVEVLPAGDAYFYIDGELVATHLLAVATTAVLTPWVTIKTLSAAIITVDVDYVSVFGVRP